MMFEALILLCMSKGLDDCSVIEDIRGPYTTLERCMGRTAEMTADILKFDKNQFVMGARCEPVETSKQQFSAT